MMRIIGLVFIFVIHLSFSIQLVQAENEFKIITLQHRFADDLLPIISPMVGSEGTATGIRNQLILRAPPNRMREIELAISRLDTARVNRKITINRDSQRLSQSNQIEASGNVRVGNVSIRNDRHSISNSGNILIKRNSSTSHQNSSQFLNVLDGERAFIRVGQIVPFTQEWANISRRYAQIIRTTDWQEIDTGFAVRPRTISNQIELEITPRIANLNSQGYIDFEELSTTLRVNLGEWVDIGNTMQSHDEISRKILSGRNSYSSEASGLIIKVD
jgi:hypothetical protein